MMSGHVVAGIFNSRRTKTSQKYYQFTDFHPHHAYSVRVGMSGQQVVSDTVGWYPADQIEWLPGWGQESLQPITL